MKSIRIIALAGVAILALNGAVRASQSTAQERAQTRQLNLEQAQPAPNPARDASTANAPPSAAPTMPVQTADDGLAPVTVTPQVMMAANVPAAPAGGAAPALAPMALNSFTNPPNKIASARVVDSKGVTIGAVQKIDIVAGKPTKVEVALLGTSDIVSLDARSLSYDATSNVLTEAQDKGKIAPHS